MRWSINMSSVGFLVMRMPDDVARFSHRGSAQSFFHRRSHVPERVHYLRMLWETVHRSKSECTASTEIVMPCFTFHATEGAPSPNTAGIIHWRKRNKLSLDRQLFLFRTRPLGYRELHPSAAAVTRERASSRCSSTFARLANCTGGMIETEKNRRLF